MKALEWSAEQRVEKLEMDMMEAEKMENIGEEKTYWTSTLWDTEIVFKGE